MCGRARCTLRVDAVPAACGFQAPLRCVDSERYRPSHNVSPGAYMPVVRHEYQDSSKEPIVHCMKWGLVPSFTKKNEKPDFFRMFNARSESVHQKASFRRLLSKGRCLVTVEGFYEWKKDGSKKQPFYIHFRDERPLVFAALFDHWVDDEGGVLHTFTILTTRSSKALGWLHDRMPVILGSKNSVDAWLNEDISVTSLQKLTQPYEASDLTWYPVTPAMGKTSFDGPECIKEMKGKSESKNAISQLFSRGGSQAVNVRMGSQDQSSAGGQTHETELNFSHGTVMNEEELKAFVAGIKADQDVSQLQDEKKEQITKTDEKIDSEQTKSSLRDVAASAERFEVFDTSPSGVIEGRKIKRRRGHESPAGMKAAETPLGKQQRTLLNFFGSKIP